MYRRIAFKKCHAISKTTGYKQSEPEILEPNLAAVFSSGLPYGEKLGQERRKVEKCQSFRSVQFSTSKTISLGQVTVFFIVNLIS